MFNLKRASSGFIFPKISKLYTVKIQSAQIHTGSIIAVVSIGRYQSSEDKNLYHEFLLYDIQKSKIEIYTINNPSNALESIRTEDLSTTKSILQVDGSLLIPKSCFDSISTPEPTVLTRLRNLKSRPLSENKNAPLLCLMFQLLKQNTWGQNMLKQKNYDIEVYCV